MRIIIAGCGYIGKLLATKLLNEGHEVIGLVSSVDSADRCAQQNIPCLQVNFDQLDADGLGELSMSETALIYLAPPPSRGQQDTRLARFLGAIEQQPPQRMVLISTTGVYGDCGGDWVDETTPLNPGVDRALRRADAERQAEVYCKRAQKPLVILRVPGIYGPGKLPLARIRKATPIVAEQDSPYTNRIHAFDLVSICRQALLDTQLAGVYNCSDGHPGTMYDYFTRVADRAGLPQPPVIRLQDAEQTLSAGMLSYMHESRRIDNRKLLRDFRIELEYPDLDAGLAVSIEPVGNGLK